MANFSIFDKDIVEVTFDSDYQSSAIQNVYHYQVSGTQTATDGRGFLEAVITKLYGDFWTNGLKMFCVESFRLNYITAQVISPVRKPYVRTFYDEPGEVIAEGVPSNTALVINLQGAVALPGKSGGKHITGLPVLNLLDGKWNDPMLVDVSAFAQKILASFQVVGTQLTMVPGMFARKDGSFTDYFNYWLATHARVMRRRTFRIGI